MRGQCTNRYRLKSRSFPRNDTAGGPQSNSHRSKRPSSTAPRVWEGGPVPTSPHLKTSLSFLWEGHFWLIVKTRSHLEGTERPPIEALFSTLIYSGLILSGHAVAKKLYPNTLMILGYCKISQARLNKHKL